MNLDESRLLGCVYVDPPTKRGYDAEVTWWVRSSELASGLDDDLGETVRTWIANAWPFSQVAYPGRDITWSEYKGAP